MPNTAIPTLRLTEPDKDNSGSIEFSFVNDELRVAHDDAVTYTFTIDDARALRSWLGEVTK